MCKNCYHSKGRNKMATACEHTDRKLYARGTCKACYLRDYHSRIRKKAEPESLTNEEVTGASIPSAKDEEQTIVERLTMLEGSQKLLSHIESNPDVTFEPK